MDRTMYGKIDPSARQPYRIVKEKGLLPGYALLADLQNSVPGHQHHQLNHVTAINQQQNYGGTPGYGSLRGKPVQSPTSYQHIVETRTSTSPAYNGSTSHNSSYTSQHSLPRQQPRSSTPQNNSGNLSELDSLLQDLSNARYSTNTSERREHAGPTQFKGKVINTSTTTSTNYNNGNDKRPSVDSLLEELSIAAQNQKSNQQLQPIYAVPNGNAEGGLSQPKRHVTITVRETTTEKLSGPHGGPISSVDEQVVHHKDMYTNSTEPSIYASSATKELDDLMASLSDFKINSSSHHHQTVTDYAKPNKGVSSSGQQTITHSETIIRREEEDFRQGDQLDSMLGNLTANMSRQGVNTVQKGCCNACEKPIVGQVITALGKTWHPEHFTCNHCNQELGTRNFFERDGFPYCEPDYHNLFSPRCAYCNGAILDKCVTALDKTWHTEHFFCAQCGQQFGEDGFHERDGKPYCKNDYFEMFAPKCNGCNRAIMENYISALNSQWHPDCFVCRDCRQPFHGGSFFDHEGLPYCETHYHAKRGSLCAGCSKPITGRCITAMFKKFHPEHFVCAFCLKQLNKGTFKEQNDKPYCHTCFDKLFG